MARTHPGATLVPHFRDFLPTWVARQSWYLGDRTPSLSSVGYFRFEDPAGKVGIETHLVTDGTVIYQIPMTYRGGPIEDEALDAPQRLIAKAEHSVLGTRWIYDGEADPVWAGELLRLIQTNGVSEPSGRQGIGPAQARGYLLKDRRLSTETTATVSARAAATASSSSGASPTTSLRSSTSDS